MLRGITAMAIAACFGLIIGACDSSDGGSEIDLGSDDKVASTLTEAEATAACKKVETQFAEGGDDTAQKHTICLTTGLFAKAFAGDDASVCQTAYDECMAAEPGAPTGGDDEPGDDCDDAAKDLENCNATLGEIEGCFNDLMAAQDAAYEGLLALSCNSTQEEIDALQEDGDLEQPASCKALEDKCPGLMGEGRETEPVREPPRDNPTEPVGDPIEPQPE
jgi:hypothetical protein